MKTNFVANHTVVTTDLLPTLLDLLSVERWSNQSAWPLDGQSVLPVLRAPNDQPISSANGNGNSDPAVAFNEQLGRGWLFWRQPKLFNFTSGAWRWGKWKYVYGSDNCGDKDSAPACQPALYDLDADLGETTDLSAQHPDIASAMAANLSAWRAGVIASARQNCDYPLPPGPAPPSPPTPVRPTPPPTPPAPTPPLPAANCTWENNTGYRDKPNPLPQYPHTKTREECCSLCLQEPRCIVAAFKTNVDKQGGGHMCTLHVGKTKVKPQADTISCHTGRLFPHIQRPIST